MGSAPYGTGPRQRAIDEALMKKAFEETKMEAPQRSYFTTSSGNAYVKKPFISKVGARVMKSLDGRPIPTEGRDNDFLVEFGLTKPKPKKQGRGASKRRALRRLRETSANNDGPRNACQRVKLRSPLVVELTPFGRSSGFHERHGRLEGITH